MKATEFKIENNLKREKTLGRIAMGRLIDRGLYGKIKHEFFLKYKREASEIEMYEECLQHEKEWLTSSILMKVPELIKFRGESQASDELVIYAELEVLIPDELLENNS